SSKPAPVPRCSAAPTPTQAPPPSPKACCSLPPAPARAAERSAFKTVASSRAPAASAASASPLLRWATIHAGDGVAEEDFGTLQVAPLSGSGSLDFQAGSTVVLGLNPGGSSDLLNIQGTGFNTLLFLGNLSVTAPGFTPTAPAVFDL